MDGKNRNQIKPGAHVFIVRKQDQRSGQLTEGIVQEILTRSPTHPHGIKVRLVSGEVGRVKKIATDGDGTK
ncbi:MAG: YwbE family protein [bacterium]|nr:YwbE family protein [bacterium]